MNQESRLNVKNHGPVIKKVGLDSHRNQPQNDKFLKNTMKNTHRLKHEVA